MGMNMIFRTLGDGIEEEEEEPALWRYFVISMTHQHNKVNWGSNGQHMCTAFQIRYI